MPRERQQIFRESNTKAKEKIIVLAFEGNCTENIYFEALKSDPSFNEKLIYLHLLSRPKSDTKSAPTHVFNQLKKTANEYHFNQDDELWMIIDTDGWKNIPEIIASCKAQGNMFVAVSKPCFEFWLLLHIKCLSKITDEEKNLLSRNPKETGKKRYIEQYIGNILDGGYNKIKPKPERFLPTVQLAIDQARQLNSADEDYPSGLGSHVYKLVETLIK